MKPSIPKGTRDFGPDQVAKRRFIFDTIRKVFIKYGYQPIETSAMENLTTLTGKYGDDGDKLLFKVLNNGDFLAKANKEALAALDSSKVVSSLSKRGLRYDLTVPFARFVVMHQNDISFPFKRYQIQPVWRADRPQKGRYQEFYQCDVDVVGSDSLMYEAELVQIYDEVFAALNIPVTIKYNNRKILMGIAEVAGIPEQFFDMTMSIDKLDKIGMDGVRTDMENRKINATAIDKIASMLSIDQITEMKAALASSETGMKGIEEIESMNLYLENSSSANTLKFECTLARGLSYYTGCIFEVTADNIKMGSIGGGGRYDDLTGMFGLKNVSGVGVSFGAERIYDVMQELDLFPQNDKTALKVLLVAFDDASHRYAFNCTTQLRQAGINSDLYPSPIKVQKQMKYANARKVPFTITIGSNEMESRLLTLKDMETGDRQSLTLEQIISQLS